MIVSPKERSPKRPLGFIVHDAIGDAGTAWARLEHFRTDLYGCLGARADALFELIDALTGAARPIRSVAELTFEPTVRRGWGSLYQALQHGTIDTGEVADLLAGQVHDTRPDRPVMFAIDVSKYPRPDTRYVPDVGWQYAAERDRHGGMPVVPGWAMQWVAQVGLDNTRPRSSWCPPMTLARVPTTGNANDIAATQITATTTRVRRHHSDLSPLFLLDIGYCPIYLTQQLPAHAQILVRLRGDRVFHTRAPDRQPGQIGRPRKHGTRMALDEPDSWPTPDAQHTHTNSAGARTHTRAWHRMHPEPRPRRKWAGTDIVEGTLIRQDTTHPSGNIQTWWLWWAGPTDAFDLPALAGAYEHRFTIEHGFRFNKQDLSWTAYTPIHPDQAERWSWLVALAYTQLWLARPLIADQRMPWEKPRPPAQLSPRRVRRGFRRATADLPTPANAPKPSRPGPGRPQGSPNTTPRTRQPLIKKDRPANTGHPKGRSPLAKTTTNP